MILTVGTQNNNVAKSLKAKTWMIMKLTIALLLYFTFQVNAKPLAQKITIVKDNIHLSEVFKDIEQQTGFHFFYDKDVIQKTAPIDVTLKDATLEQALTTCLKGQQLDYTIVKRTVVIRHENKTTFQSQAALTPIKPIEPPPIEIHGEVLDENGNPLANASVTIKATNQGVTTNNDGNFTISVPNGKAVLIISFTGYQNQEILVGNRTTIQVNLVRVDNSLNEVVVTALGIKRSAKSLTYATTNISAEDLNQVKGANVLNSLAGKAAGVFVTQGSGGPGSSPRIILRGEKSIMGDNQPLYVVDGIPIGGFSDFNSEDIESLEVLQGASAAALYGSRAANGVILITTKKGKFGTTSVNFESTSTFARPFVLPEIQTTYGQGLKGISATTLNDSWGPKISDGSGSHIKNFFRTGKNYINSLALSSGNEKSRIYMSYANTYAKAMIPGYNYLRNNFTLSGTSSAFNNKITIDGGINYINSHAENRSGASWQYSPLLGLYLFPPGDDLSKYSSNGGGVYSATRGFYVQNWPYLKSEHSLNQNPYWIINHFQRDEISQRTYLHGTLKYNIANWLNITGRANSNNYTLDDEQRFGATSHPSTVGVNGSYSKGITSGSDLYMDVLLSVNKALSKDFKLNAVAGYSSTTTENAGILNGTNGSANTLYFADYFSVQGLNGNFIHTEFKNKTINHALFGTATLGLKETLFFDITGRNEWSSTTSDPFFYPSFGLSYILTNTIASNDVVSFAKIRASFANVGNALPFGNASRNPNYSVGPDQSVQGRNTLPFFSGTDTVSLKPELTKSYEIGIDARFFKNKLTLSFTYYNATTTDQVFTIAAPSGAGATNFYINGGTIQNKGIEATLNYKSQFGQVKWTPTINFSKNTNVIKKLSDLLTTDRFVLNNGNRLTNLYLLRPGSNLLKGRKYGSYLDLFGKTYVYQDGKQQFDATTGLPVLSKSDDQYIGNANPKFLLSFNNEFRYKEFNISFLIDGRFGGLISSSTEQWLDFKGISKRSGEARDAGGVKVNGKLIDPETYYSYISAAADFGAVALEYTYSSTNIRLRELAIGYTFSKFSNTFKNLNLSLVGRNLLFFYKKAPFDPELALSTENAGQGFESFQIPSERAIGLTLRVGF